MPSKIKRAKYNTLPPKTEVECKRLQEEYLKEDCSKQVRDDYFLLLRTYARSLALKEIKRKGIFLQPERVDEICTDAALLLMKQYTKPGWKVLTSFAGALYWKLLEAMYGQASEDMVFSLNTTFSGENDGKEFLDLVSSNACLPWQSAFGKTLEGDDPWDQVTEDYSIFYSEIGTLVDDAYNMLPYKTFVRFLPWIVLQLRKPRARNTLKTFKELYLDSKEEEAFNLLFLELKNRIAEQVED